MFTLHFPDQSSFDIWDRVPKMTPEYQEINKDSLEGTFFLSFFQHLTTQSVRIPVNRNDESCPVSKSVRLVPGVLNMIEHSGKIFNLKFPYVHPWMPQSTRPRSATTHRWPFSCDTQQNLTGVGLGRNDGRSSSARHGRPSSLIID